MWASSLAYNFESQWVGVGLTQGPQRLSGPLFLTKRLDSKNSTDFSTPLGVGKHTGDLWGIRHRNEDDLSKFALGLGRLRGEDMAHLGLAALELAGTSLLEALGRAGVCLQLWHGRIIEMSSNGRKKSVDK